MLLFFYGTECPHCKRMEPLVAQLETDLKVKIERKETWHDEANARALEAYDPGGMRCGGVPFFFNTESNQWLCGESDTDQLKAWALGKGNA